MDRAPSKPLPTAVVLLGVTSLLTDVSSEIVFTLLPVFLALKVANAPVVLGAMEGIADALSAYLKYWSGARADRTAKLKPLVLFGYSVSSLARPMMAFVTQWWHPLLIRAFDRVGKGVRSSPRDALIASAVDADARGRAFGFHRGMDHAGAAIGAGLAALLLWIGLETETIFLLAAIPGWLAVATIVFIREAPREVKLSATGQPLAKVPRRLWAYLGPVLLFGLANSTDAFLLLKLSEQGAKPALLPLAWLLLHLVKSAVSFPAGRLSDRLGHAKVVTAGWAMYALSYLGLAFSPSITVTLVVIAFYGLYHAFAEGAEKALLVALTPPEARGRAFGLYNGLSGAGSLFAGVSFGLLWNRFDSSTAFLIAGAVALTALALFRLLLPTAKGAPA